MSERLDGNATLGCGLAGWVVGWVLATAGSAGVWGLWAGVLAFGLFLLVTGGIVFALELVSEP